jgi:hypothetical protein
MTTHHSPLYHSTTHPNGPQITHRGLRPQPKKGRRGEDEKKLQITKKMAAIIGYVKCSLKRVFQDATKKFLQKKQEIERLYYRFHGFFLKIVSMRCC